MIEGRVRLDTWETGLTRSFYYSPPLTNQVSTAFNRYEENLIANLRNLPENPGPANYDRSGRPYNRRSLQESQRGQTARPSSSAVSTIISRLIEQYSLHHIRPETVLMEHWHDIIGEEYADNCQAKKILFKRKLIVSVSDSIICSELSFERRNILKRLKQWPGLESIQEITFVTAA